MTEGTVGVRRIVAGICVAGSLSLAASAAPVADDYARAERVLDANLRGKVANAAVRPNWLPDGRFWYPREDASGHGEVVLVDPALGSRHVVADGAALQASVPIASPQELLSPDGRHRLSVRDNNLWLATGSDLPTPLTHDGEASYGYGVLPDFALRGIPRRDGRLKPAPFAVSWSPDSRRVFGVRYDERRVLAYPYLATAPTDSFRPVVHEVKLGLLGDAEQVRDGWFFVDVDSGRTRHVAVPEGWNTLTEAGVLGWSEGGDHVYIAIVRHDRPARIRLLEINARSGEVRTVLEESSTTRVQLNTYTYGRAAVRILPGRKQAVWYSARDGWGHLYLVDLRDGRTLRQLTRGAWGVRDVVGVDADEQQLVFTAGGREPGDPYQRRLYRVALDAGEPVLLSPEVADHAVDAGASSLLGGRDPQLLSPSGAHVIDCWSTLVQAPVCALRSTVDGRVVLELERADDSAVRAAGWQPPRRERLLAADGVTPVYATLYLPPGYNDNGRFPVIDAMYGGPHVTNAPVAFVDATATMNPVARSSLAQLGFAVVSIDARGTPGRSKAFHDVSFLTAADDQLDDHVTAIQQLAQRYPGLDLDRVGIYGHSFGGYSAARALLRHPDFYKVGVASAGSHSFQGMYGGGIHGMDRLVGGAPVYADGSAQRPADDAIPALFRPLDNGALAHQLRGKLMLVYGDLDENAMPALTLQLARALNAANKDYDLLYLANQDHELFRNDRYYMRRMWDYFVTHLMGETPPAYQLGAARD
ncbi:DPP IV N-terminal domain-containing protein [Stenotrophomonas sp. PS02289]|uniref:S9 family peptidase n=1 Tax=Stenotrophomonas sp. PS02289 TaxID=2991422 RepID=UPI002499B58D|nr:DPP IV N-terminal domain-containing protein [Stenotrophomonas sp. PS02289]